MVAIIYKKTSKRSRLIFAIVFFCGVVGRLGRRKKDKIPYVASLALKSIVTNFAYPVSIQKKFVMLYKTMAFSGVWQ